MLLLARAANDAAEPWGFFKLLYCSAPMRRPKEEPKHSCDDFEEAPRDFASLRGHVQHARKPLVREGARSAYL